MDNRLGVTQGAAAKPWTPGQSMFRVPTGTFIAGVKQEPLFGAAAGIVCFV